MSNQSESLESVVIGDGVVVKGTFTVPSKAIINGVIEGDLTAEEVLIGPTGRITGRVSAKVIDVRGQLHNTIISEKSLIVRATGKIAGKVQYAEIEIEKGGEIEGTLSQNADGPAIQVGTSPAAEFTSGSCGSTESLKAFHWCQVWSSRDGRASMKMRASSWSKTAICTTSISVRASKAS